MSANTITATDFTLETVDDKISNKLKAIYNTYIAIHPEDTYMSTCCKRINLCCCLNCSCLCCIAHCPCIPCMSLFQKIQAKNIGKKESCITINETDSLCGIYSKFITMSCCVYIGCVTCPIACPVACCLIACEATDESEKETNVKPVINDAAITTSIVAVQPV